MKMWSPKKLEESHQKSRETEVMSFCVFICNWIKKKMKSVSCVCVYFQLSFVCVYLQLDQKKARSEGKQCHSKNMKSKRS